MSPLNITQHHPTIRYMVYNGYYKVMSNIPKMGHLTTPVSYQSFDPGFGLHQKAPSRLVGAEALRASRAASTESPAR